MKLDPRPTANLHGEFLRRIPEILEFRSDSPFAGRLKALQAESDPELFAEAIWALGLRCRSQGREEDAVALWDAFLTMGGEGNAVVARKKIRKELAALRGEERPLGWAVERQLSHFSSAATDPKTIVPMLLASSFSGVLRLRGLAGLSNLSPHWTTRGVFARGMLGTAGLVSESTAFVLAQRGMHSLYGPSPTGSFIKEWSSATMSLGFLKLSHGLPLPSLLGGTLGLSLASQIEAELGWKPRQALGELWMESAASLLALQAGMNGTRALFPSLVRLPLYTQLISKSTTPFPKGPFSPAYGYAGEVPRRGTRFDANAIFYEPVKMSNLNDGGKDNLPATKLSRFEKVEELQARLKQGEVFREATISELRAYEGLSFLSKQNLTLLETVGVLSHRQASGLKSNTGFLSNISNLSKALTQAQREVLLRSHERFFEFLRLNFRQAAAKGLTNAPDHVVYLVEKTQEKGLSLDGLCWVLEPTLTKRPVLSTNLTAIPVTPTLPTQPRLTASPPEVFFEAAQQLINARIVSQLPALIQEKGALYASLRMERIPLAVVFQKRGGWLELAENTPVEVPGKVAIPAVFSPAGALLRFNTEGLRLHQRGLLSQWENSSLNAQLKRAHPEIRGVEKVLDFPWKESLVSDISLGLQAASAKRSDPRIPYETSLSLFPMAEGFGSIRDFRSKNIPRPLAEILVRARPPKNPQAFEPTALSYEVKSGLLPDSVQEILDFLTGYAWLNK